MATLDQFNKLLTKLTADVDAHFAKEVKAESDLASANAQIVDLKGKLAAGGGSMSAAEEADLLAQLTALEAKLNQPTPPTDPTADPAPGPLPVNGPNA